jgi:hypothetical protein
LFTASADVAVVRTIGGEPRSEVARPSRPGRDARVFDLVAWALDRGHAFATADSNGAISLATCDADGRSAALRATEAWDASPAFALARASLSRGRSALVAGTSTGTLIVWLVGADCASLTVGLAVRPHGAGVCDVVARPGEPDDSLIAVAAGDDHALSTLAVTFEDDACVYAAVNVKRSAAAAPIRGLALRGDAVIAASGDCRVLALALAPDAKLFGAAGWREDGASLVAGASTETDLGDVRGCCVAPGGGALVYGDGGLSLVLEGGGTAA